VIDPVSDGPVKIGLARFDPTAPGVPLNTIDDGEPVALRVPPDSAPEPWIVYADAAVRVCAIDG